VAQAVQAAVAVVTAAAVAFPAVLVVLLHLDKVTTVVLVGRVLAVLTQEQVAVAVELVQ
jgi:hypothetical protein